MSEEVSKEIREQIDKDKEREYEFMNDVEFLIFLYLIGGYSYREFNVELTYISMKYGRAIDKGQEEGIAIVIEKEKEYLKDNGYELAKEYEPYFKLDKDSQKTARERYLRVIRKYYKDTSKMLKKEYIDPKEYLSKKLNEFDKVEKVVPYFDKEGKVVAYHTVADYSSMVYNTNLTRSAWNESIASAEQNNSDLMYIVPHMFSCEMCQKWQGKIISIRGLNAMFPSLEMALEDGYGHPNCKHVMEPWTGQVESDKYSNGVWVENYKADQKIRGLKLKRDRMNTDKRVFKKLGNQSEIDKINQKLNKIKKEIRRLSEEIDREA